MYGSREPRKRPMAIKTTSINLDEDIHMEFKLHCTRNKKSMGAVISGLMQDYLTADKIIESFQGREQ